MIDLRISNRSAVLTLLHQTGGLSRKEIASKLQLTPATISYIVRDMLEEGVLTEERAAEQNNRFGPREIMLKIDTARFRVMCAYVTTYHVNICCADLAGNIYFRKALVCDQVLSGAEMLKYICQEMCSYINTLSPFEQSGIIGAGFGVKGICDNKRGESITSFGLWEDNLSIKAIAERYLGGLHVMVDNDIRCLANAEILFGSKDATQEESVLLVKYGLGVGSAFMVNGELFCGHNYRAIELAHYVVDPLGSICRCGKRGCLETVAGFDILICTLKMQYSKTRMPILYELTSGHAENITAGHIIWCYEHEEKRIVDLLNSALDRLALAITNCVRLLDPKKVTLYGFPFESGPVFHTLKEKIYHLNNGDVSAEIEKSVRNMELDDLSSAAIVIRDFITGGAVYKPFEIN